MEANVEWKYVVPVLLALGGYLFKYVNDVRMTRHRDRLERVNKQLRQLYGPLYALTLAGDAAWRLFRKRYRPNRPFWIDGDDPSSPDGDAWRLWMTTVFVPNHEQMERLVLENADLLMEPMMEPALVALCAHIASYKPVLRMWREKNFAETVGALPYPKEALMRYAEESYRHIKGEQARLLALTREGTGRHP